MKFHNFRIWRGIINIFHNFWSEEKNIDEILITMKYK